MRILLILTPAVCILFVFLGVSSAKNLGTFGATYPVIEKDALKEMEEKARQADVSKFINKKRLKDKISNYRPPEVEELKKIGPARTERTFLVDMTYSLQNDIPDGQGRVLYPKGYTFNPLDYISYPNTLVILNGKSPKQLVWFKASEYAKDYKTKLLITDGSYLELSRSLKRPVFYASKAIINIFRIGAVPSVIRQKNNMMEVTEIAVGKIKVR